MASYLLSLLPGLILPLIAGPVAAMMLVKFTKKNQRRALILFGPALILFTLASAVFMAYNYGDFFPGPGAVMCFLSPLVGVGTAVFLVRPALRARAEIGATARRWLLIGAMAIPMQQIATPFLGMGYSAVCDRIHAGQAGPIIAALAAYQRDQGNLPFPLEALVPNYIDALPTPACLAPLLALDAGNAQWKKFDLYPCLDPAVTLLTVPTVLDGDAVQRYNLSTGNWSVMDTFEGVCSFLK